MNVYYFLNKPASKKYSEYIHVSSLLQEISSRYGISDKTIDKTVYKNEYTSEEPIGEACMRGYHAAEDWQVVPGTWIFQVWDQDRMLAEKSFTMVKPAGAPR